MVDHANLPVPSVRMARLFSEYLGRYNDWKAAKLQEKIGLVIVFWLGWCILLVACVRPGGGIIMVMLVPFCFALRHYFQVNQRVSHLYVNVHILHHHLIGKLEVGFCDHCEPCHCVEEFRGYVLRNYNISLEKGSLR